MENGQSELKNRCSVITLKRKNSRPLQNLSTYIVFIISWILQQIIMYSNKAKHVAG